MDAFIFHVLNTRQSTTQQEPPEGANKFLDLLRNSFSTELQKNAFWASLGTSLGISAGLALLFSILRPHNTVVYAPKLKNADEKHAPPPLGKGLFAWVKPVFKIREAELVDKIGMDATIFLRFTRMLRNMFIIMAIIGCAVMIPTNVVSTKKTGIPSDTWSSMTPLLVWGDAMWAHVVISYLFNIIVAYFLWRNYGTITRLRRQYFDSQIYQTSLHSRTLMITHIPNELRSDEGVARLTGQVNVTSGTPLTVIGRNVKILPDLIKEHDKTVHKLESYLSKYLKDPDHLPASRPTCSPSKNDKAYSKGQKVDAIEYLTSRIRDLERQIIHVRETVDMRDPMPFGFSSFESIPEAHAVAYSARRKHPDGTTIKLAPRPSDIIWKNLPLSKGKRRWKRFMNNIWVTLLTIIWVVPNALIAAFLTNLSNLGQVWPAFKVQLYAHPTTWAAVQGILSPAILSLVYLYLPTVFRRLAMRAGDTTKTSREKHVTHRLYAFFVFNNLVVFSFFSAIWAYISYIVDEAKGDHVNVWKAIQDQQLISKQLFPALCQVSQFWVIWLLQRNLGAAVDIAQLWTLFWVACARAFGQPTPRQLIQWTAPPPFEYAAYYNYFLFYSTVALCFATLQPIVLLVTAIYFALDASLKKYLLMYVFVTKTESGGQFWRILFNRLIFATILSNFVVALAIYARATSKWTMLIAMIPAPLLMLGFKWWCARTFDDRMYYYNKSAFKDPEANLSLPNKPRKNDRLSVRFGNPVLYKRLITPMVHAKATGVLSKIYQGRLQVDEHSSPSASTYGDVHMAALSASGRAIDRPSSAAPFESVPEGQLDFFYYKNRDEFGDEHGAGEIYGQHIDALSDRPSTPSTIYSGYGDRTGSPVGYGSRPVPYRVGSEGSGVHPAYRTGSPTVAPGQRGRSGPGYRGGSSDLGTQHQGLYSYRNESEAGLVRNAAQMPLGVSSEREESVERIRQGGSGWVGGRRGYGNVPQQESEEYDPMSYDYFREQGRGGGRH
ncbi:MAG: Transmembrane protein 63C [Vezdaea acicularis]|nr:MAG: Transmembrane protein 63C [Vezdaea acicularis]